MNSKIKIAYSEEYVLQLPPDHKFPILKYKRIPETLLQEGTITGANLFAPGAVDLSIVKLTHNEQYISRMLNRQLTEREILKIGFPLSRELVEREFIITNGTVKGSLYAMENGIAFNVAGGTHHAYSNGGEGFCLLNDVAVAANYLLHRGAVKQVLVVDLDVHQGNGTAKIFENEQRVFTFSMHGKDNYPLHKERSDLDIPLNHGIQDEEFLTVLNEYLPRVIRSIEPDFIFYISGVDVLSTDRWGKLGLSNEGCRQRDEIVFHLAKLNHIPVMVSMGGGYSPELDDVVEAHCNTYRAAFEIY